MKKDLAIKSRKSALHGIMCSHLEAITSLGEENKEIEKYVYALLQALDPKNALEYMLSIKIITNLWRCKRLFNFEASLIRKRSDQRSIADLGFLDKSEMEKIAFYDRSISKAIQTDLDLISRMQSRRRKLEESEQIKEAEQPSS